MKYLKSVAYAYPTSPFAEQLGGGGYFIQQQVMREDNTSPLNRVIIVLMNYMIKIYGIYLKK